MARSALLGVTLTLTLGLALGCDSPPPTPAPDASSRVTTSRSAKPEVASAKPSAAPAPVAPHASADASADGSASAAPSASAASSAVAAAPRFPSEVPSAEAPTAEELGAHTQEIVVKASGEQKCSTKVLKGWFEIACGPADGLVRATKVDVEAGFDASRAILEPNEGITFRWVAPLPADGSLSRARLWGKGLHEIFLTLTNTETGWKGQLSGKRPAE